MLGSLTSLLVCQAAATIITTNSERVTLPSPAVPGLTTTRSGCPHEASGLLSWNDGAAWASNVVPTLTGGDYTLAAGVKVKLQSSPTQAGSAATPLGLLTIPSSSELILGENPTAGVALHANGILVEGALRAGAEGCRLDASVSITLHGARIANPAPEYKGILVSGAGTLELHGKQFFHTWTRLARSVTAGDTNVLLQGSVNWEAGQQVLLTTTAIKDARDWHRNEVRTIASVTPVAQSAWAGTGVGAVVELDSAAQFDHEANAGYQGEVALLSRRIVVQGADDDSPPTDTSPSSCNLGSSLLGSDSYPCPNTFLTGFGGHIMARGGSVTAKVAGVELFQMGQTNKLGRYPLHFHLMGEEGGARSYMRDCSVYRSYYRCVSIHGTSRTTLSQNVAYDVTGHCYYLEDGVEEENLIEFNLAAHVHFLGEPARSSSQFIGNVYQAEDLTQPADVTASGFYVSNMNNVIVGNAASGGWAGFAFPELPDPIMIHRNVAITPSARMLQAFEGNSAHSSAFWWQMGAGGIYVGGRLYHPSTSSNELVYNPGRVVAGRPTCRCEPKDKVKEPSCAPYGSCLQPGYTVFNNTKVFLLKGTGLSHWGSRIELRSFEAHDVGLAAAILGYGFITDMLVRCRTGAQLQLPCDDDGCDRPATLSNLYGGMKANGFIW